MQAPYIPPKDADYGPWLDNFAAVIAAAPSTYLLSTGDATAISAQATAWDAAYALAINPSTRTPAAVAAKNAARATATAIVRPYSIVIANSQAVSNDDKIAVGVNLRGTGPTPIPQPSTSPILGFIAATPLQHTLRYADQNSPALRMKPFGAIALQLWAFVGSTVPTGVESAAFIGPYTKIPMAVNFVSGQAGKTAYYWSRWITRTGLIGPWSAMIQAVVI